MISSWTPIEQADAEHDNEAMDNRRARRMRKMLDEDGGLEAYCEAIRDIQIIVKEANNELT